MVGQGFSGLQHAYVNFWAVMMGNVLTQPVFTDLLRLTETMVYMMPEADDEQKTRKKKLLEDLDFIDKFTNDDIKVPLSALEMLVFFQLHRGQGSLNKELDIDGRKWLLIDLYRHLDGVNRALTKIVVSIMKDYNVEIPLNIASGGGLKF